MSFLTIAIPAFRRPELLAGALDKAVEASQEYDVSFLVCDDSPDKVNESVAKKYALSGIKIRYLSNSSCLGIDANIKKCFDEASSDYVWVIGEDDQITPGAVEAIEDAVQKSAPDVLFLNYVYCSNDYSLDLSKPLLSFNNGITRESILAEYYKFGFIGGVVFSKDKWSKYSPEAPLGTYFHHLSVMGKMLFSNAGLRAEYLATTNIRNRAENGDSASWTSQAVSVHFGYYEAIRYFESDLSSDEWDLLLRESKALFRPTDSLWLLSKRADGAFDADEWRNRFSEFSLPKRGVLWLVAHFPVSLAKLLKWAYFKCKRG